MKDFVEFIRGIPLLELTAVAYLGLLVRKIKKYNKDGTKITTKSLLLDLPVAIFMGIVSSGVCSYYGISGQMQAALVAAAGYIGPIIIDFAWDQVTSIIESKRKDKIS